MTLGTSGLHLQLPVVIFSSQRSFHRESCQMRFLFLLVGPPQTDSNSLLAPMMARPTAFGLSPSSTLPTENRYRGR